MIYTEEDVLQYVQEEDVKFIRLAFCDVLGNQKNVSIMPHELKKAFKYGIAIDGSEFLGFQENIHSDLFLHPDCSTLSLLPWRPERGRVVRLFCDVRYPNGDIFENDTRNFLKRTVQEAQKQNLKFSFGTEMEFYLFKKDEKGNSTCVPHDEAGYMDIAPIDKGENVRREICLTLEQMGILPESSHHEEGPGQNEIDFRYSDPVTAADNTITFKAVVRTIAEKNGLYADFSPKPIQNKAGSGMHINISAQQGTTDINQIIISSLMNRIKEMTLFLNPSKQSYLRLGKNKAPKYISWSKENRYQLIRVPAAEDEYRRIELRSPDSNANPYLVFALIIKAVQEGIESNLKLPAELDVDFNKVSKDILKRVDVLPHSLKEAKFFAEKSDFVRNFIHDSLFIVYDHLK